MEAANSNDVYGNIEKHIPPLRRYARVLARNPTAAEDLLQEALTRALVKSRLFKSGTNLRAWLFTILHNEHVSMSRRKDRTASQFRSDDATPEPAVQPTQDLRLLVRAAERALAMLPETQRSLIMSVARDGVPYMEIARRANLPAGTVKSRVSRGRQALRHAVGELSV